MDIQPLFLFSLPRSGSTLAQRILASHEELSTTPEPWILLPYLYTLRSGGISAKYQHKSMAAGIQNFCRQLPNGTDDYLAELREFVLRLYGRATSNGARYFLDKTPRYHLVVDEVIHLFPKGKFIFLWRNPLAVVASIMETWGNGRWNLHLYQVDLFEGLANLIAACETHRNRAYAVRYEDLLSNSEDEWRRIFTYLDLTFDVGVLSRFTEVQLTDPSPYPVVSSEPLDKWKRTLASPVRKSWCRRYLRWIGSERLAVMGYDSEELLRELDAIPSHPRFVASDLFRQAYGVAYCALQSRVLDGKQAWRRAWRVMHGRGDEAGGS